ncbi:TMEM175 family protein [Asticcacaulis solisilvae]|uniref:TMEM175 family protein n=1 Tax=Asticcacaulis solisilvae TaxID=1217274 RepID=UPI003FD88712
MKTHDTPEKTYDLERLIFFSDGVFAIAITILVIELHPPEGWDGSWGSLLHTLFGRVICYVISFSALACFWTAHRFIFRHVQKFSEPASLLNLAFLLAISLMPFANAMLLEHVTQPVAVQAYIGLISIAGTIMALLWAYLALIARHIDSRIGLGFRWLVFFRLLLMPPLLSFSSVWVGQHFGVLPSIIFTTVIAAVAGRFGFKPMPSEPSVKEL